MHLKGSISGWVCVPRRACVWLKVSERMYKGVGVCLRGQVCLYKPISVCVLVSFYCDPSLQKTEVNQWKHTKHYDCFKDVTVTEQGLPQQPPFKASHFRPAKRTGSWKGEGGRRLIRRK